MVDDGYDGEGDFALYRSTSEKDEPLDHEFERVLRSNELASLRQEALRAAQSGKFKYVQIWRWVYDDDPDAEGDNELVEDFM